MGRAFAVTVDALLCEIWLSWPLAPINEHRNGDHLSLNRTPTSLRLYPIVVAVIIFGASLAFSGVAQAAGCQPPDGIRTRYFIAHQVAVYSPTNLASDWVIYPHGGSVTFTRGASAAVNAAVSAGVSAEAGVIFAKASSTIGVTVGKTWTRQTTWSYTANMPADTRHKYRFHLYHLSYNFTAYKQYWFTSSASCGFRNYPGFPSNVSHAPAANGANVWRVDSAPA